jgi:hypothetical protein
MNARLNNPAMIIAESMQAIQANAGGDTKR